MNGKLFGVALLAISLAVPVMSQTDNPGNAAKKPAPQGPAVTIPLSTGTAINATLIGSLDSQKSKPGDPVNAVVSEAVVYQRSVLLPKGSQIVGRVVRTGADGQQASALFVEFDRVILKNGQTAQLNAGIQALAPVGAAPTIPSREKYEQQRLEGSLPNNQDAEPDQTQVLPSTYTVPRRSETMTGLPASPNQGGLDRKGMFTPDSKGAFSDPSLRVFTPVSEGSHGTVLVGNEQHVRLENGTHLLIVVQPPAS